MSVQVKQQLQVDDLFRAAELIAAIIDQLPEGTLNRIQRGEADKHELGRLVISVGLRVAPESGRTFLAGLCNMSPEEFSQKSMDAVLDVVEQLKARDDVSGFFERARSLAGDLASPQTGKEKPAKAS